MKKILGAIVVCGGLVVFGTGCSTVGDWCMNATLYIATADKTEAYAVKLAYKKIDALQNITEDERASMKIVAHKYIQDLFAKIRQLKTKYDEAKAEKIASTAVIEAQKEQAK